MGNPAPFQARSRMRNGTGGLRRSGAISVSHCHSPNPNPNHNHTHVDCPCCSSTLTNSTRYAPYALAAHRAFQLRRNRNRNRRHHPLAPELVQSSPVNQPNDNDNNLDLDMLHLLDDNEDDDPLSDSQSQSDSHSHSDSHSDSDDLDAIPFPYSSSSATASVPTPASPSASSSAFAAPRRFSFNRAPSPPPIPRLPSSSEIQRLYATLPTTTTAPGTLSANAIAANDRNMARFRRRRNTQTSAMFSNIFNNSTTPDADQDQDQDQDPEPWMYGTLPRRAAVTLPIRPRRPPAEPLLGDRTTHMISPSSGVTAASTSASSSSSTAGEQHQPIDGRGSLVGNVIRGMYSSLTSLLGSGTPATTSASTSTATDPGPHILTHNPYMTTLHPTHTPPPAFVTSAPTTTSAAASASASTPTLPADLASTSVSSTRPVTRPRPRPAAPRRPTGLALAPTLSARSRGTLASAAAQAHAEHHVAAAAAAATPRSPWDFPGVPTYHAFGPADPSGVDDHFVPPSEYHGALGAYAYAGGGRGGRIEYPPTPRAFYATVGVGSVGARPQLDARQVLADPSAWGGVTSGPEVYRATARDAGDRELDAMPLAWLGERAASLHGAARDEPGAESEEEEDEEDEDEDEDEMQRRDEERERALMTYIPESWLRPSALGGGGDHATSQGELQAGQDDDEDELGPMDDSWEMVVRPFDSARGPATPYNYHEHMF